MSIQAVGWALDIRDKRLLSTTKFTLVSLCNYADERGVCWPSQERLALDCGLTSRTVRSQLKRLEELEYIKRTSRFKPDGTRHTDVYQIVFTARRKDIPVAVHPPESDDTSTGNLLPYPPEAVSGKPSLEPSIEEPSVPPISPHAKISSGKRKKVPDDWTPNEKCRLYAASKGNTDDQIRNLAEQFRNHHAAKGSLFANIDAAWRTWVGNDIKFNGEPADRRGGGKSNDGGTAPYAAALDKLKTIPADDIRRRV